MRCFFISIFFIANAAFSQNNCSISGIILDSETELPISNVYLKILNTKNGTSSNKEGRFFLTVSKLPVDISITHIAYETQNLTLHTSDIKNLKIHLVKASHRIPEVIVGANKVINLVEKRLFAVNDYEFMGNNILTLLFNYNYSKNYNPWLVLMNTNGDTLCSSPAGKDGTFYKDCTGTIHFVDALETHQIFYDSTRISLLYPAKTEEFFEIMQPCISNIKYYYYLNHFSNNNQILSYYVANNKDSTYEKFRLIVDETGLKMLASRDRFHAMGASPVTEADIRFEQMCFFDPLYAPLFKIKNEIVIFNFVNSKIEFYNETGQLEKEIEIAFHKMPFWKDEMYVDEVCGKAYSLFLKDGLSTLKEIDLQTGKFLRSVKIPNFKFVSKIKIHNNRLYFLYKKNLSDDLMGLYMMEL